MFTDEDIEKAKQSRYDAEELKQSRRRDLELREAKTQAIIAKYLHGLVDAMPKTGIPPERFTVCLLKETKHLFKESTISYISYPLRGWMVLECGHNRFRYRYQIILDDGRGYYYLDGNAMVPIDELARVSVGLVPVGTGTRRGAYQGQRAVSPFAFAAAI